ncbi:MAG: VWA domain-containing protein [Tepidiformaceae bacterium]
MSEVEFGRPFLLGGLAVAPLALALWWWRVAVGTRRARALSRGRGPRPPYVAATLLALAALAGVVAAAQPRWGTEKTTVPREGADLIVVIDVSRSMAVTDVAPSRLQAAKAALATTFQQLSGDRVGVVIFGGSARLRFPLTTDLGAAAQVVSSLETGTVIVDAGSSATSGLDIALDSFEEGSDGGRVILLITDGDDLGADPAATATRIRAGRVDLLVAGAGTAAGGPVPIFDSASKTFENKLDAQGNPIISRLNEPFLRALAAASGGRYIGASLPAVPGAVQGRIASLERLRLQEASTEVPVERYQWFAAAALALLLLATVVEWLPRLGRRSAIAGAAAGLLLFAGCATHAHELNDDGRVALQAGDTERAIDLFIEAQAEQPDDARIALNLAKAYDAAGRYEEAAQAARRALLSPDDNIRARAHASIGHHLFGSGQLRSALGSFRQALILDPRDEASRHDYEVLLRLLEPPEAPPDGDSTQQPGDSEDPGGEPGGEEGGAPGGDDQQPGESTAGGGRPASPQQIEQRLAEIDRQVERLLREAGEDPSAAEALQILNLIAERNRMAALRDAFKGRADPLDY